MDLQRGAEEDRKVARKSAATNSEIGSHYTQYDHPDGVSPQMSPRGTTTWDGFHHKFIEEVLEASDDSFFEMTGKQGDVILMHPLMLHSASKNGRRLIREFRLLAIF